MDLLAGKYTFQEDRATGNGPHWTQPAGGMPTAAGDTRSAMCKPPETVGCTAVGTKSLFKIF